MNQLKIWMDAATVEERNALAKGANTTLGNLQQIAGGYRTGGRPSVRAEVAYALEHVARELRKKNPKLPVLLRTDLSPACYGCDLAQKCLGNDIAQSDFEVVG